MPVKNVTIRFLLNGSPISAVTPFYVVSIMGEKSLFETDENGCYQFVDFPEDKFFVEYNGKKYFVVVTNVVKNYGIETAEKKPTIILEKKDGVTDKVNKGTASEQPSVSKTNSFNYAGLLGILLSLIIAGSAFYICWEILFDNGFKF